ncbi:MAG TPA: hypothetical protein PLG17_02335 [Thermodesulfobacteriota bacterium]|nr:hypothetical protein [Deltaproteobacteria bacterium]HNR13197.1 hypothetical protein [Thermodesulfobacteriota bacterium]HNU70339.1 hypothetical protein [Thermodesulfobacteriota bacterium]HOC38908.1 hypothetical protein [Thermodesulfobacteriota bacterium]HQO77331.1 hypothetical protein [Thermodesulfobacteriota bacterium]
MLKGNFPSVLRFPGETAEILGQEGFDHLSCPWPVLLDKEIAQLDLALYCGGEESLNTDSAQHQIGFGSYISAADNARGHHGLVPFYSRVGSKKTTGSHFRAGVKSTRWSLPI